jgi:hypothetical protein
MSLGQPKEARRSKPQYGRSPPRCSAMPLRAAGCLVKQCLYVETGRLVQTFLCVVIRSARKN